MKYLIKVGEKVMAPTLVDICKSLGISLAYFTISGILTMFAEGYRDVARSHAKKLLFATGLFKRPVEETPEELDNDRLLRLAAIIKEIIEAKQNKQE